MIYGQQPTNLSADICNDFTNYWYANGSNFTFIAAYVIDLLVFIFKKKCKLFANRYWVARMSHLRSIVNLELE